jgi:hypothetical protein
MSDIMIACQKMQRAVPTGLTTEKIKLESMRESGIAVPLKCPACGRLHYWTYEDAWIHPSRSLAAQGRHDSN